MAIFQLDKQWFENLSIQTQPKRHFSSASLESTSTTGITGSVHVFSERSKFEKEAQSLQAFSDSEESGVYGDDTLESYRQAMIVSSSVSEPEQISQVTELTFSTETADFSLSGGSGTEGSFDYRDLLGHSSYEYIDKAFFDLHEPSGVPRRFYFYNSSWGDSKKKPTIPLRGSRHMIDLYPVQGLGDPTLPPDSYDVSAAMTLVVSATDAAINTVSAFSSSYSFDTSTSKASLTITNSIYGDCIEPITGTITNPITGKQILDLDLDADGIGDQDLPTFPFGIFDVEVSVSGSLTSINGMLEEYLSMINNSEVSSRKQTEVSITRFEPSFKLTSNSLRKNVVKDILFPHYRTKYPDVHWAYTNYNTINFFTSSLVPESSALIYPSFTDETVSPSIIPYSPSGSFTFEFYINPRYTIDEEDSYAKTFFIVSDWEKLLIDHHGGGHGAHDSDWDTDWLYEYDIDGDGNIEWIPASSAGLAGVGYTGFYLIADDTDVTAAVADPDGDGIPDDPATHALWDEDVWFIQRQAEGTILVRHENLITDKGDESPDYDFRSGDPIKKHAWITVEDGVSSGPQSFNFAAPGSLKNASDWTIGKNELGDFDNFETAKNIAKTIDGNQYFTSWAEKIEIIDEVGQQRVNEASELLWTDDNGLNEYSLPEALLKDVVTGINGYQATSAGLLWNDGFASVFTARSKGYGEVVAWDASAGLDTADILGYTGWYDSSTFTDVEGPFELDGTQRWVNPAVDIAIHFRADTAAAPAGPWTGYYDPSDPAFPNVLAIDYDPSAGHRSWTEQQWANYRGYRKFPIAYTATAWSEAAWALRNEYAAAYYQAEGVDLAVGLPDESIWMTTSGYFIEYTSYADETEWAAGQGYNAVITYRPTEVYGKVWIQTNVPGWAGNAATSSISTERQSSFVWYAFEKVDEWSTGAESNSAHALGYTGFKLLADNSDASLYVADPNSDGIADDPGTYATWTEAEWAAERVYVLTGNPTWGWVAKYETSSVSEDAREAFQLTSSTTLPWSAGPDIFHATLDIGGGLDHVVVDRDKSHQFKAGTILHMSSSYAVSLVTGSHIDQAGHPDAYRLILQLSSSADIPPSGIPLLENGAYGDTWNYINPAGEAINSEKVFVSSDNSLRRNEWHHVAIRYGTDIIDGGKAQVIIDGKIDSEFNLPTHPLGTLDLSIPQEFGDIIPKKADDFSSLDAAEVCAGFEDTGIEADPAALFIGNFFEGKNAASYTQTKIYVDPDGSPTLEGDHVAEKYAWYIQEVDSTGMLLWQNGRGVRLLASQVEPAATDQELRDGYFTALMTHSLTDLEYVPILSSTLAYNIGDLVTDFTLQRVYDQALSIDSTETQYIQGLFSYEKAETDGITWGRLDDVDASAGWTPADPDPLEPNAYALDHPLNAEVHELKIWNEYRTEPQLSSTMADGIEDINETLLFYLPPFFTKETRQRDVMLTPFQTMRSSTDDPFNVAMSFGVGGHLLNLENFTREMVKGEFPILMNLSGSTIDVTTTGEMEANELLNLDPQIRKRNLTILPCDNGKFVPDFTILASGTYDTRPYEYQDLPTSKFVNDYGTLDYSKVSLRNMVPEEMMQPGLISIASDGTDDTATDSIFAQVAGSTPENPGVAPGSVLAILQRTRDTSSNEVVFFDSSNLFYGQKIKARSFKIVDNDVTGSAGKVKITLRDNGFGVLYRADAATKHATWAATGNILYEEGIAVITNPCIPYFGKEQFSINMEGVQNVHVMEVLVPCSAGLVNSSSNPNFESLKAGLAASDDDTDFVYITGLNFHDENLNIIARTNLAQPVAKRDADSIAFRIKVDF
jgi:hypothetical protein